MSKRRSRLWILISAVMAVAIAAGVALSFVKTNIKREFCVVYEGKKLLTDVTSFALAPENAEFQVQTLDGESIDDYTVSVKAVKAKKDFAVRFNDVEELLWSDYVAADVEFADACAVTKNGGTFTLAQTRVPKIFANKYPTTAVDLSAMTTVKNLFEVVVTVDGQSIHVRYYVKVNVENVGIADEKVEFGV